MSGENTQASNATHNITIVRKSEIPRNIIMMRIKYNLLADILRNGGSFIIKCKPFKVYRIKKKLSEMLGEPIEHVYIGNDDDGRKIYLVLRKRDLELYISGGDSDNDES